jgi:hypothetical protein
MGTRRWDGARRAARQLVTLAIAAVAAATPTARSVDAQPAAEQGKRQQPFEPSALFSSDSVITLTLIADFPAIFAERDTLDPKRHPGVVRVVGPKGEKSLPVVLHTRGHFRLRRDQCGFPPLRVIFDKNTKHTPFDDQGGLKLVTHCSNGSREHEQYVLREYLTYRAHALVTPASFRARLARVRYVPVRDSTHPVERWGFFLESEREMGRRMGGRVLEARNARYRDIADSAVAVSLWQYFIGNTDWSLAALHNVRLVQRDTLVMAVPYDFDHSGMVDARYATADARLALRSVRERLWRGPCTSAEALQAAAAPFLAQRAALEQLPRSLPGVDGDWAGRAEQYVRSFFDELRDPARFASTTRSARPGCPVSN